MRSGKGVGIWLKRSVGLFILTMFASLLSCSHNSGVSPTYKLIGQYKSALKATSRRGKIYQGLETLLLADVVYYSPQYQEAYRKVYYQDHNLKSPREQEKFDKKHSLHDRYRFLVAVFSDRETWHELTTADLGRGSIWTLSLVNRQGEVLKPIRIKELEHISEYVKTYGGFYSPWRKYYHVDFPRKMTGGAVFLADGKSPFSLKISSLHGFLEFFWSRDGSKAPSFSASLPTENPDGS